MVFVTRQLRVVESIRKWAFAKNGYCRFGLYYDDIILSTGVDDLQEARRRLPPELYEAWQYRMMRATRLDMNKIFLPREQWTTYEEDITKGRYLQPYLAEVQAELEEKKAWNAAHSK